MKRFRSGMVFLLACVAAPALGLLGSAALGDNFTWQNVDGGDFITPARNQGAMGSCWSFGAVETLEAKYMLTRNDPTFDIYLSEQNLICDNYQGGYANTPFTTGICTDAELAYTATTYSPDYPLQPGWQQRVVVSTSELVNMPGDIASMKADLKAYGPLDIDISAGDLDVQTLGTGGGDHAVLAVGYVDDPAWAGGGYFIVKNSWGTSPNGGFCYIAYANETRCGGVSGLEGTAYFTGTMYFSGTDYSNPANLHTGIDATATWKGGLSKNVWDSSTPNWVNNGTGAAFTWVNQEVGATFDNSSLAHNININGTAIAHSLTFTAAGYQFNGGALTVTAGGITADQSVTINSPITVGAPQAWTVAPGQSLTVWSIHTVISDLTLNGAGGTTITGAVDGGGAANLEGQPAGRILQNGPGRLAFTAGASCVDTVVFNGGTLSLGMTGTNFSGNLDLNGPLLQVVGSSSVSGGTLAYSPLGVGGLILSAGTLQDDGGGRTLATAVTIDGNVTLAGAGSTGVSFAPLGLTTPNVVTMNNSPTITVTAPTTIGDQIVGSSGFTMDGPSVLTLTAPANNSIGGPITVSGGTLQGTAANLSVPIVLANNANLTYLQNTAGTLALPVRGTGSVTKTGGGVLTLGAPSFYQGATTIRAGTLQLPASAANAGLVLRYSMDGPLGAIDNGTTIVDLGYSPNGNNGTMVGAWANYVPGQFGQAILFNGMQYIQTPYSSSLDIHRWTTSLWINVNTSAGNTEILNARNSTISGGYGCDEFYNPGSGQFYSEITDSPGGWIGLPTNTLSAPLSNGWHMITTTVTTGSEQIYVDGVPQFTNGLTAGYAPALMVDATDWLGVGEGSGNGPGYLPIDEFQLYNTVLSTAQIQKVYQNQMLGFGSGLPSNTPVQLASGATFDLNGCAQTIDSLANVGGGGGTVTSSVAGAVTLTLAPAGSTTFSGRIQNGAGQVSLVLNGSGTQVLSGSNTYTGGTTISSGTLQLGDGVSNNGSVAGTITDNACLTFANPNTQSVTGTISGSGSVTKTAAGVLILAGSNLYSGGTEVDKGTLVAANGALGSATGSGTVTLSGGILASGVSGGSIQGGVVVSSVASEIAPGGVGSIGHLTIGSLTTASNLTTLDFDLTTPGGSADLLTITGGLTLAPHTAIAFGVDPTALGDYRLIGGSFGHPTLSDFTLPAAPAGDAYSLSTSVDRGYIDLVVSSDPGNNGVAAPDVPEPSTFALLGIGVVGLLGYVWRRKWT